MSLVLTIVKSPDNLALAETSKTFGLQGGSIGRGGKNDWVLADPECFMSTRHCEIGHDGSAYYLTDQSTNGTFVNGSSEPMGKGNQVTLNDGDRFMLGDYEFQVSIASAISAADPFQAAPAGGSPFASNPEIPDDDIFGSAVGNASPFSDASAPASNSGPLFSVAAEETDPLAALDKAQQPSSPAPFASNNVFSGDSHSDQASPVNQSVAWPQSIPDSSGGVIPDDWDLENDASSSVPAHNPSSIQKPLTEPTYPAPEKTAHTPLQSAPAPIVEPSLDAAADQKLIQKQHALEEANKKIMAELESLKQAAVAEAKVTAPASEPVASAPSTASTSDKILISALGFDKYNLSDEKILEISQIVGDLVRVTVTGLMQTLSSRSSIKNEFRMSVTTIQPVENNPLKFSVTVDDALENMFIRKGNSYKKPVEAVSEGFDGIAEHQMAVLAGIRAAFKGLLERFDPVTLEHRFEKQHKGGIIPGLKNSKNWESFCDYYNEIAGDIDNSFQYLFGDDFVRAYEDQLQRLTIARKSQNK